MPVHKKFIENAVNIIKENPDILGLAAGGSWISGEMDEYSDLDLVLVTERKVAGNRAEMTAIAEALGRLINSFTGEHVGESRLLICLYDNPLLHVDIKFLVPDELEDRVEDPVVCWERDGCLSRIIESTESSWPGLDFQWVEDRFWTWVHYAAMKLGRGEYFEALDFLSFLRMNVTAPLLQIKNGKLPRGVRKAEFTFNRQDIQKLAGTVPAYIPRDIMHSLEKTISLYSELRRSIFPASIELRTAAEKKVMEFLHGIKISRDNF